MSDSIHAPATATRAAVQDCAFLAAAVLVSSLPYIGGMGFYSDDWAILSELHAAEPGLRGMWEVLLPMGLATRPVQGLLLAGLFTLFGLDPLGYHVTSSVMLAATVLLFYLSLRRLGLPRIIALTAPLLYGLLPHYSTARFWIAAFQAQASVLLFFLSVYADLRFVQGTLAPRWAWKLLALIALAGSLLAYELTGVLFLVTLPLLWYAAGARAPRRFPAWWVTTGLIANLLVLAATIGYKLTTTGRAGMPDGLLLRALRILTEAAPVHFGDLGAALPLRVLQALQQYHAPGGIIAAVLIGVTATVYLLRVVRAAAPWLGDLRTWAAVVALGLVLFVAGYGVSLMTWEIGFHATGTNNRTAGGATIGTAIVFTGVLGALAALLRAARWRWRVFATLAGLLAASGTLIVNAVAAHWIAAVDRQHAVITRIYQRFPTMAPGTTLLLDGLCPFQGPAVVFATDWDVRGMLQLTYRERALRGDVIKPNTEPTSDGVRTLLFDDWINRYPYGDRLLAFDVRNGQLQVLRTETEARRYLEETPRAECPPYTDGDGVTIF